jgi:hypothetical protein
VKNVLITVKRRVATLISLYTSGDKNPEDVLCTVVKAVMIVIMRFRGVEICAQKAAAMYFFQK